jgi:hypothetical protein
VGDILKKAAIIAAVAVAAAIPTSIASAQSTLRAELSLSVKLVPTGKIVLSGTTNLPDGTHLMLSVDSQALVKCRRHWTRRCSRYYGGQTETVVRNGRFTSERFSDHGNAVPTGTYLAEALMPIASVQPQHVQAVIGKRGERLLGPLVKRSGFGGAIVNKTKWFRIV